jgi:hypothetical protein
MLLKKTIIGLEAGGNDLGHCWNRSLRRSKLGTNMCLMNILMMTILARAKDRIKQQKPSSIKSIITTCKTILKQQCNKLLWTSQMLLGASWHLSGKHSSQVLHPS